jgi:hypothetical protein
VAPAASVEPQVVVLVNVFDPLIAMLAMPTATPSLFVTVTVWLELSPSATPPNARLVGETVRPSVVPFGVPVPVNATVCEPVGRVKVSEPVRVPVALGVKVTLAVQLLPAASELRQVCVWEKSPVVAKPLMATAVFALLVTVTI